MYCGICIDYDYDRDHVDIYTPAYVIKQLQNYAHLTPKHPHHATFVTSTPPPIIYAIDAQKVLPDDDTPILDKRGYQRVDQIIGRFYITATL